MVAIEAEELTRIYQVGGEEVRALDGLTVSLERGSLAAVVGPSGSGKSTLMALLGGLDTPSSGSVSVYGQELNGMAPVDLAAYRRSTVGFVFQDFFLLSHLTAIENVEVPLKLARSAGLNVEIELMNSSNWLDWDIAENIGLNSCREVNVSGWLLLEPWQIGPNCF